MTVCVRLSQSTIAFVCDVHQEKVTETVPQHVDVVQTIYPNTTLRKVMETNLTWGPSQDFILQFTLVSVSEFCCLLDLHFITNAMLFLPHRQCTYGKL